MTLGDRPAGGVFVEARARPAVPVRVTQEHAFDKAVVDLTGVVFQVPDLRLSWFDGPANANSEAALLSPEARTAFTDSLLRKAMPYLDVTPPDGSCVVGRAGADD